MLTLHRGPCCRRGLAVVASSSLSWQAAKSSHLLLLLLRHRDWLQLRCGLHS